MKNRVILVFIIIILLPIFIFSEQNLFLLSGEGKFRFRDVQANKEQITGVFGENLKSGLSFRQRFDLSLEVLLTDYLSIGSTVRISNEESRDMLPPPDFISTKAVAGWWFASLKKAAFNITVGSYDASFTPLTLMRWDPNDNPLGAAGCGCQVAVGGISGQSLEELQADYKLEGALVKTEGGIGDITLLYARPQIANEAETFTRHLYGLRGRIVLPYTINFSTLTIGITGVRAIDDTASVEQANTDPLRSDAFGFDINLPLFWKIVGIAEYTRSIRDDNLHSEVDIIKGENGIITGLKIVSGDILEANALYLYLDPYFSPLYRAISYAKNRQGFRGSFIYRKLPIYSQQLNVSCYLKGLREIKPTWNEAITEWHNSLANNLIGNIAANLLVFEHWQIESSFEYRKTNRAEDISTLADERIDLQTQVTSLSLGYEFTLQSKIILKYQFINNVDGIGEGDYKAHIPSLQFSFKF